MGLFGFGKNRDEVVDLTNKKNRQKIMNNSDVSRKFPEKDDSYVSIPENKSEESQESNSNMFSFFGNTENQEKEDVSHTDKPGLEERRRKLAKRLSDMTDQIENLSNQIYHLQQRVEVLERKSR